jgi:CO/xanthine dehydrogenase Mo-binding subunit
MTGAAIPKPPKKLSIIGTSPRRIEGREKASGAAQYVDDLQFGANLLAGKIKHSTMAHARLVRINTARAKALPGVRVVITGEDFPGYTGLYLKDRRLFALDRVRYVGDAVAAVAADTEEIADQALDLI